MHDHDVNKQGEENGRNFATWANFFALGKILSEKIAQNSP
jgi:hypothetical protein